MPEETQERNLAVDLKLNKYALDSEAENQPSTYHYWSEQLTEAKKARDTQKSILSILKAEKGAHFRMTLDKATAQAVEDAITMDEDVQTEESVLRDCEAKVSTLYSTVSALEQKKSMIDNLTKLYLGQYFSTPPQGISQNASSNLNHSHAGAQ